jgi:hypothetical protein
MKSDTITTSDRRRRIPSAARSTAPRRRPDRLADAGVEQHRADPVAAAGEQLRDGRGDLGEHEVLAPLHGPDVHRGGAVEQQPRGDLAVLDVLPHVGCVGARGDVPVDVAQIVAEPVLPQVRDVDTGAAEGRPVVAL